MSVSSSLKQLQEALSQPEAYPYAPEQIDLEQTHISLVALAPPWVYKIKKPVELGFLDFSTLQQRYHYCRKEVRLNRRLCPDIYKGVVPIVRQEGHLLIDPDEEVDSEAVVEYAVKMKHLAPDHFLSVRIEQGEATTQDIDRVACTLSEFYRTRTSRPEIAEEGWIERLRVSTDENFEQTADHVGTTIRRPVYDALRYYTDRFYDQHAALLHRRRAGGFIVDGHGDLRLEHIHLTEDRLCIYDCIEFNERFRHLDIANDIAFLAMDLDLAGRTDLSRRLVTRVSDALGDDSIHEIIDFYKSYRAYVRAKVEGMRAAEEEVPPDEREKSIERARRHYQWALRYAVAGTPSLVVVVMGRPGTGKTTQAEALADVLNWSHVSSDRVRKNLAGVPLYRRADASTRKQLYTPAMSEETYSTLRARAVERARQHKGTVLDATYSRPSYRDRLRTALRAADVPHVFVELTAPDEVLKNRLAARSDDAPIASDARAEDFETLNARYEAPDALEDPRHVRIDAEDRPEDTTLDILKALIRLND